MGSTEIKTQLEIVEINYNNTTQVYGTSKTMYLGRKNSSTIYRMLFKFPISMIPSNCIILKATLKLYVQSASLSPLSSFTPFALTENWSVDTVSWANQPTFDPNISGEALPINRAGFYTFNITEIVLMWYSQQISNYGIIIKNDEIQDRTYHQIATVINSASSPVVKINYTERTSAGSSIQFIESIGEIDTHFDDYSFSHIADVSLTKTITCHVENLGDTPIEMIFQSSPDGILFSDDVSAPKIIQGSQIDWVTPYSFAKYGRVAVRNINPSETSRVRIWYQAQQY